MILGCDGLRILACGLALATMVTLTVGLLHVLEAIPSKQEDWIPLHIYPFLALAFLAPMVVGLLIAMHMPRNTIAWILLLGTFAPSLPAQRGAARRAGLGLPDRAGNVAAPVRLADRRRIRLPERPPPVAPLAVGRRRRRGELRVHDRAEAVRPRALPAAECGHPQPVLGNRFGELIVDNGLWIPFFAGRLASLFAAPWRSCSAIRRSAGIERLQMQWLVWAISLVPLAIAIEILAALPARRRRRDVLLLMAALVAVVVAIGIAVVRYRLYAIERLINRTLVYVALTLSSSACMPRSRSRWASWPVAARPG